MPFSLWCLDSRHSGLPSKLWDRWSTSDLEFWGEGGNRSRELNAYTDYIYDISDADLTRSSISMCVMEEELTILGLISGIEIHTSIRVSIYTSILSNLSVMILYIRHIRSKRAIVHPST